MFSLSDHINKDKNSGQSRSYKIVFVPKKVSDTGLYMDNNRNKVMQCLHVHEASQVPGGGGTPLQEANGDVPLDGVAFSRLE